MRLFFLTIIAAFLLTSCADDAYDNTADIEFLKENANKPGVVVTQTGLQYKVIEEGSGSRPNANSTVKVHYTGRLIDGEVFDSSHNGEPSEFNVAGVVPGFAEGLQLMRTGSVYELYIPSNLGYGNRPPPNTPIRAGSTLIFEVELIEIL